MARYLSLFSGSVRSKVKKSVSRMEMIAQAKGKADGMIYVCANPDKDIALFGVSLQSQDPRGKLAKALGTNDDALAQLEVGPERWAQGTLRSNKDGALLFLVEKSAKVTPDSLGRILRKMARKYKNDLEFLQGLELSLPDAKADMGQLEGLSEDMLGGALPGMTPGEGEAEPELNMDDLGDLSMLDALEGLDMSDGTEGAWQQLLERDLPPRVRDHIIEMLLDEQEIRDNLDSLGQQEWSLEANAFYAEMERLQTQIAEAKTVAEQIAAREQLANLTTHGMDIGTGGVLSEPDTSALKLMDILQNQLEGDGDEGELDAVDFDSDDDDSPVGPIIQRLTELEGVPDDQRQVLAELLVGVESDLDLVKDIDFQAAAEKYDDELERLVEALGRASSAAARDRARETLTQFASTGPDIEAGGTLGVVDLSAMKLVNRLAEVLQDIEDDESDEDYSDDSDEDY